MNYLRLDPINYNESFSIVLIVVSLVFAACVALFVLDDSKAHEKDVGKPWVELPYCSHDTISLVSQYAISEGTVKSLRTTWVDAKGRPQQGIISLSKDGKSRIYADASQPSERGTLLQTVK